MNQDKKRQNNCKQNTNNRTPKRKVVSSSLAGGAKGPPFHHGAAGLSTFAEFSLFTETCTKIIPPMRCASGGLFL